MRRPALVFSVLFFLVLAGVGLLLWTARDEPQTSTGGEIVKQALQAPAAGPKIEASAATEQRRDAGERRSVLVLFDFDQSVVRRAEAAKLDRWVDEVKATGFERLDAVGHADRIGTGAYNLKLSGRRAEAVKAHLAGKGVDRGAVRTDAKGESQAVTGDSCDNMGPETRKNRALIECLQPDRRVAIAVVVREPPSQ